MFPSPAAPLEEARLPCLLFRSSPCMQRDEWSHGKKTMICKDNIGVGQQLGLGEWISSFFLFWGSSQNRMMLYNSRMDFSAQRASKLGSAERSDINHRLPKLPQKTLHCRDSLLSKHFLAAEKKDLLIFSIFFFFSREWDVQWKWPIL